MQDREGYKKGFVFDTLRLMCEVEYERPVEYVIWTRSYVVLSKLGKHNMIFKKCSRLPERRTRPSIYRFLLHLIMDGPLSMYTNTTNMKLTYDIRNYGCHG